MFIRRAALLYNRRQPKYSLLQIPFRLIERPMMKTNEWHRFEYYNGRKVHDDSILADSDDNRTDDVDEKGHNSSNNACDKRRHQSCFLSSTGSSDDVEEKSKIDSSGIGKES